MKYLAYLAITFLVVFPPYLSWHSVIQPLSRVVAAHNWQETESTSLQASLRGIRKGKAITEVTYTFEHNGKEYSGDTLTFWKGTDSGHMHYAVKGKESVQLWFDPDNPENSSIVKGIEWKNLIFGLIPVFFSYFSILILWGIIVGLIETRRKAEIE